MLKRASINNDVKSTEAWIKMPIATRLALLIEAAKQAIEEEAADIRRQDSVAAGRVSASQLASLNALLDEMQSLELANYDKPLSERVAEINEETEVEDMPPWLTSPTARRLCAGEGRPDIDTEIVARRLKGASASRPLEVGVETELSNTEKPAGVTAQTPGAPRSCDGSDTLMLGDDEGDSALHGQAELAATTTDRGTCDSTSSSRAGRARIIPQTSKPSNTAKPSAKPSAKLSATPRPRGSCAKPASAGIAKPGGRSAVGGTATPLINPRTKKPYLRGGPYNTKREGGKRALQRCVQKQLEVQGDVARDTTPKPTATTVGERIELAKLRTEVNDLKHVLELKEAAHAGSINAARLELFSNVQQQVQKMWWDAIRAGAKMAKGDMSFGDPPSLVMPAWDPTTK